MVPGGASFRELGVFIEELKMCGVNFSNKAEFVSKQICPVSTWITFEGGIVLMSEMRCGSKIMKISSENGQKGTTSSPWLRRHFGRANFRKKNFKNLKRSIWFGF